MALLESYISYMHRHFLYVSASYPRSWNVVYIVLHCMYVTCSVVPSIIVFLLLISRSAWSSKGWVKYIVNVWSSGSASNNECLPWNFEFFVLNVLLWHENYSPSIYASNPGPRYHEWDYRWMDYPPQAKDMKHPSDVSVSTYKGHSVLRTLIRSYFSPAYRYVLPLCLFVHMSLDVNCFLMPHNIY